MLRAFLPVVLGALALASSASPAPHSPSAPQGVRSVKPAKQDVEVKRPPSGVHSVNRPEPDNMPFLDAAEIAALRARVERAKANGTVTPERLARQEERLARLEAQLLGSGGDERSPGGVHAIGTIKHH